MAFRRCGWQVGSARPPALSGILQSGEVGSGFGEEALLVSCVSRPDLVEGRVVVSSHTS